MRYTTQRVALKRGGSAIVILRDTIAEEWEFQHRQLNVNFNEISVYESIPGF